MSDRSNFWKNNSQWPDDSVSYLFLARALDRLGKSFFPNIWTGAELWTETFKLSDYIWCDDRFANNLLAENEPRGGRRIIHALQSSNVIRGERGEGDPTGSKITDSIDALRRNSGLDIELSESERKAAHLIAKKLDVLNEPLINRARIVRAEFVKIAKEGTLTTAYRAIGTAVDVPIPPVWWDTDHVCSRFYCGQLNPKSPYGDEQVGGAWIFVFRKSLDQIIARDRSIDGSQNAKSRTVRYSGTAAKQKFREWRGQRGTDIPTEREDIAHMKQFGVGRDAVRDLRETVPKLPRGRPGKYAGK
jgi:hypothetical protein